MRILANENFPEDAVIALRNQGLDIVWIRTDVPGISDDEVLERATREKRVVITFDKDFGELAFRLRRSAVEGIILFRISTFSSTHIAKIAVAALQSRTDWAGHFAVVEENRIRLTALPRKEA